MCCPIALEKNWTMEEMSRQLQNWTIKVAFLSDVRADTPRWILGSPLGEAARRYLEGCGQFSPRYHRFFVQNFKKDDISGSKG